MVYGSWACMTQAQIVSLTDNSGFVSSVCRHDIARYHCSIKISSLVISKEKLKGLEEYQRVAAYISRIVVYNKVWSTTIACTCDL